MADRFSAERPGPVHPTNPDQPGEVAEEAAVRATMGGHLLRTVRANFKGLPCVEERWARARREGHEDSDEFLVDSIGFRDEWRDLMDILRELHEE